MSINREATLTKKKKKNTVVERRMLGPGKKKKNQTNNNEKKIRKREREEEEPKRGPREERFWKVLHLAAWNVEYKGSATGVKAKSPVTVNVITKSATEFILQYEYMISHK